MDSKNVSMKNKSIYIITLAAGMIAFNACRKNDNPKLPEDIQKAALPQFTQDNTKDLLIQSDDLSKFNTAFAVGLYFPDGEKPTSTDVVVAMNGKYNNIKVAQGGIGSLPSNVTLTGAQLVQLFGIPPTSLKPGDYFEVTSNFTMSNGRQVHGFGDSVRLSDGTMTFIRPFGGDPLAFPNLVPALIYTKVCPLFILPYVRTGKLKVDDPGVTETTYEVQVAVAGADSTDFTFTGWADTPGLIVKAKLSKQSYQFTVPKQVIAANFSGYHNLTVSGSGTINPCDSTINFNITTEVAEGTFGNNATKVYRED